MLTLNEYQKKATKTAIYPGAKTPLGLAYVALKRNGEAGEFAEHVGKAIRDEELFDFDVPFLGLEKTLAVILWDRQQLLMKEIGDVLWYLSAACNELGVNLEEVAQMNLDKLASRQERGQLQGSGDNR